MRRVAALHAESNEDRNGAQHRDQDLVGGPHESQGEEWARAPREEGACDQWFGRREVGRHWDPFHRPFDGTAISADQPGWCLGGRCRYAAYGAYACCKAHSL